MKSKKIYSALMTSALCATSIVPQVSTAFAYEITETIDTSKYLDFSGTAQSIKNAWNAQEQNFAVYYRSTEELTQSTLKSICESLFDTAAIYTDNSAPIEGDYLKYMAGSWTVSAKATMQSNIYYYTLTFTLSDYDSTMKSKEVTLQTEINSIINSFGLSNNATDYQKIQACYNWIINNITKDDTIKTPYDVVTTHRGGRNAVTLLSYRILRQMGVSTRIVKGSYQCVYGGATGLWLLTKVNGQYYYVDPSMGISIKNDNFLLNGTGFFTSLTLDQYTSDFITNNGYSIGTISKYSPTNSDLNPSGGTTTTDPINYTATINSYLKLHKDVTVPNLNVNYSVVGGNADSSKDILAGINANNITIDSASFNNSSNKLTVGNGTVTLGTDEVYVQNSLRVTLTDMKFTAPGKYRYIINQNNISNSSITPQNQSLIMDVSVSRNGETYSIVNVTFSNGTSKVDGFVITDTDEPTPITKTYDLMVSNTTTGNGADLNKYFEYNVSINGLTPNKTYVVNGGSISTNPSVITTNENGVANATIWLKNGDTIKFNGLDENARYIITKSDTLDNYTTTSSNNTNSQLTTNTTVTFTNSKGLNVDTGVVTKIAPFAFLSAMAMGGLAIFKKKKENN